MKDIYCLNDNVTVFNKGEKYIYTNPKTGSWLKVSSSVKEAIDGEIYGESIKGNIPEDKKQAILARFEDAGILDKVVKDKRRDIGTIYFVITKKCNLNCKFCSLRCSPEVDEQVAIDTVEMKKIVDNLTECNVDNLIITGGEPSLRKDVLELIDYIHEKLNCKLTLETNGLLLNDDFINSVKGKLHHIDISFENIFEENAKWQYDKLVQVVEKLKEADIPLNMSYVLTAENNKNIFKFLDLAQKYEPANIIVRIVAAIGNGKENSSVLLSGQNIMEIYRDIYEYIYKNKYDADCIKRFAISNIMPRINCSAKGITLFVDTDGNTYSCPSLFYKDFCYGNIVSDGLDKVLANRNKLSDSTFYKECFEIDKRDKCRDCEVRYFCGGSCFAELYANKEDKQVIPIDCKLRKLLINFGLWEFDSSKGFFENLEVLINMINKSLAH